MSATHGAALGTRWAARLWSLATLAFVGLFFVASLLSEGFHPRGAEFLLFLCYPVGLLVGLVIAWWNELVGGVAAVTSLVGFYAIHALVAGGLPGGPYFLLLAFPGVLFIVAALLGKERLGDSTADD